VSGDGGGARITADVLKLFLDTPEKRFQLMVSITRGIENFSEDMLRAIDRETFFENLECLNFFFAEIRARCAGEWSQEVSKAAHHGDWDYLAAYIEAGKEITPEMRPSIIAALRGEPRVGNPPKTRTEIDSYTRALFVVQREQEGMKLARAKEAAEQYFDVSDTTLKKDIKANAADLRKLDQFYNQTRSYVEALTNHGVRNGWIERWAAEWHVSRVIAQLTPPPAESYK
jgi:hypothetical protein